MNLKKLTRIILLVAVLLLLSIVPVSAVVYDNGAFDSDYYLNNNGDVVAVLGTDPATAYDHYRNFGIKEGRAGSAVFDVAYYVSTQSDLAGMDYVTAYNHFVNFGMSEGRTASRAFNVKAYLAKYDDVRAVYGEKAYASAFMHYLFNGINEGRDGLGAGATVPEDHTHDFKLTKIISAATCINDGEGIYTCEKDGATETRVIPASADYHDWTLKETTAEGVKISQCNICKKLKTEVPETTEHVHNYVEVDRDEATCTQTGTIYLQCINEGCNAKEFTKTEVLAKIPHKSDSIEKILQGAVSCKEDRANAKDGKGVAICSMCGNEYEEVISAHNYDEGTVIEKATCTTKGTKKFTCKDCGETKTEEIPALGHKYTETTVITQVTCEKDGLEIKVCTNPGCPDKEVVSTVPATGHKKPAEAAITYGYAVYGNAKNKNEITDIDSSSNPTEATCTKDLAISYDCANPNCPVDGNIFEVVEKRLGHSRDTSDSVNKPYTKGTLVLGTNGLPTEDANGHIVVKANGKADCTHDEVAVYTCANKNCDDCNEIGEVIVVLREATEHTPRRNTTENHVATCESGAYTTFTCDICEQKITKPVKGSNKLGHNYKVVSPCTEDAYVECSRCKKTSRASDAAEGKQFDITETEYTTFANKPANKTLLDKEPEGHKLTGNVYVKDGKDTLLCKKCNQYVEVTVTETKGGKAATIAVTDVNDTYTDETIYAKIDTKTGANGVETKTITVISKAEYDKIEGASEDEEETKTPLTATITAGEKDPNSLNRHNVTITREGNTVKVKENVSIGNTDNAETPSKNQKWFCVIADLGINPDNIETTHYTIEDIDKTDVSSWISGAAGNKFVIWLSKEGCGANGKTITFSDKTGTKAPVTLTFTFEAV